jgi:hypothetical protein
MVSIPVAALVVRKPCKMLLPLPSAIFAVAPSSRIVAALVVMTAGVMAVALACESSIAPE